MIKNCVKLITVLNSVDRPSGQVVYEELSVTKELITPLRSGAINPYKAKAIARTAALTALLFSQASSSLNNT